MPRRTDIHSILVIGAGPIVIGQACEFDYSGTQACQALRAEGYRVILINSNPATIMTDPATADAVYIEPITTSMVEKIIAHERPSALLPTMGGQTALNTALELERLGVLARYQVELIGAQAAAIRKAEDRDLFKQAMTAIGLESARSYLAHSLDEAQNAAKQLGSFPLVIRPSFTLGGSGGGIAYNAEEFLSMCARGLEISPVGQLLIEESLIGWKEFEMEVVRDCADNAIIVCSIENLDPMGVHTGDSITVAPAQTLTDKEYQVMRNASLAVLREIGVETGGSNVQFAINPADGRMVVIEMNPRVSRSSALASKATGFPIAKVAARLAVGYTLDELMNDITGSTPASFEPTIDYIVTKIPRFAFEKFAGVSNRLGTQMKSVGEVMALGSTFAESLNKALRGLEAGLDGLNPQPELSDQQLEAQLREAGPLRIVAVAEGLRRGWSCERLCELTHIDPWFVAEIALIVAQELSLRGQSLAQLDPQRLRQLKQLGFADSALARSLGCTEQQLRQQRHDWGIRPVYKRVDSCAGEFATAVAYLYSTYQQQCEAKPSQNKKIMILGSGPNRIGQGIEFDYCCVHAALALRQAGFETLMVNCNPETVSTDYDTSDRLYFEPLTLEDVLEIVHIEQPWGVIVQYGGQTPLKLARELEQAGVHIIGTSPDAIDLAEDRDRFSQLVNQLGLRQPANAMAHNLDDALDVATRLGFPLVVRPSYVLGGRAMKIVHNTSELQHYMKEGLAAFAGAPVLLDRYLSDAIEVDVDAIGDGTDVVVVGLMQHVEEAGIHSGDSACSLPPYNLDAAIQQELRRTTVQLAHALKVVGLMNVQFAIQHGKVYLLEVNPRASRTVPFVAKATGVAVAGIAARIMAGEKLAQLLSQEPVPRGFAVKEAVFPFNKFLGVDPQLGPEMRSTGEVMGHGASFEEAFAKAEIAAGHSWPTPHCQQKVFIAADHNHAQALSQCALELKQLGFVVLVNEVIDHNLNQQKSEREGIRLLAEGQRPSLEDKLKNDEITLVLSTLNHPADWGRRIRQAALEHRVPLFSTTSSIQAVVSSLSQRPENFSIRAITGAE